MTPLGGAGLLERGRVGEDPSARKPAPTTEQIDWLPSYHASPKKDLVSVFMRSVRAGTGIIGFSEVVNRDRRQALKRAAHLAGYTFLQEITRAPGFMECAIAVDTSVWEILGWEVRELGPDMGPGDIVLGIAVVARHRHSKKKSIFIFVHMPAGVEGDWKGDRAAMYREANVRLKKWIRSLRRRYKIWRCLVFADWNLNIKREWVETYFRQKYPAARLPKIKPSAWTHAGGRFIDFCLYWGYKSVVLKVLKKHPHSDHRGVRATVQFT